MGFFSAEDLIIDRLDSALDGKIRIKTAADMAAIEETKQVVPAIYVVYAGFEPTRSTGGGAIQEVEHTFYVVVAVSNKSDKVEIGRKKAEWMIDETIKALAGLRLEAGFQPLLLKSAPQPVYSDEDYAYFPLAFATRAHYRGQN
ncbi:MAG: hypothetical protein KDI55_02470 [Anaerolineae bacterium]|nr:hypothetical protein [Anaerolineae bacterium]MCP5428543.1 hypothetical protein [Chromatiaceae bacterium]